jgi:hypothetical protein
MTVIDSHSTPTQAKVTISGTVEANAFGVSTILINTFDCDIYCNNHPDIVECPGDNASATMEAYAPSPQHEEL